MAGPDPFARLPGEVFDLIVARLGGAALHLRLVARGWARRIRPVTSPAAVVASPALARYYLAECPEAREWARVYAARYATAAAALTVDRLMKGALDNEEWPYPPDLPDLGDVVAMDGLMAAYGSHAPDWACMLMIAAGINPHTHALDFTLSCLSARGLRTSELACAAVFGALGAVWARRGGSAGRWFRRKLEGRPSHALFTLAALRGDAKSFISLAEELGETPDRDLAAWAVCDEPKSCRACAWGDGRSVCPKAAGRRACCCAEHDAIRRWLDENGEG